MIGSARPSGSQSAAWWSARKLMVGVACATGVLAPTRVITQGFDQTIPLVLLCAASAAIVGVYLQHAYAAIRGEPIKRRFVSFGLLLALVYTPMGWVPLEWAISQVFVVASAAMVFRHGIRIVVMAAPIIVALVGVASATQPRGVVPIAAEIIEVFVVFLVLAGCLIGVTMLVRAMDTLDQAQTGLAERAASQERLRMSRDLHDLLGQSLSAISLKGDLARALVAVEPKTALREIDDISTLTRETLHAMRQVTVGEHAVSLAAEARAATALLAAAKIETQCQVHLPDLAPAVDRALGWGMREGVTNILRHSTASWCAIAASRRDGMVFLEIRNDGAARNLGSGNGLSGLAARAEALQGQMTAGRQPGNQFHVRIEIPETRA